MLLQNYSNEGGRILADREFCRARGLGSSRANQRAFVQKSRRPVTSTLNVRNKFFVSLNPDARVRGHASVTKGRWVKLASIMREYLDGDPKGLETLDLSLDSA